MRFRVGLVLVLGLVGGSLLLGSAPAGARKKSKATPAPTPSPTPAPTPVPTATPTPEQRDTADIYEAVLLSLGRGDGRIYVSLDGQVPDRAFIERMARHRIFLWDKPAPRSIRRFEGPARININKPRWVSPSKVEVYWGDVGSGSEWTLEKQDGRWRVTQRRQIWIR